MEQVIAFPEDPLKDFNIEVVPRETILQMVKEEQAIRYSKGIQEAYTMQYETSSTINIEREIQKFVLGQFGFKDDLNSLEQYWKIPSTYWNDAEIKNSLFYMKLNIFEYPPFQLEDDLVNVNLVDYDSNREVSMRSLGHAFRPLVLLAGSMTWPPFRASMDSYQRFYDTYSGVADIYLLYILEAHFVEKDAEGNFTGGWPIGYQYNYSQHKSMEDRRSMVKVLIDEYHPTIPTLMDNATNDFQNTYHPWPDKAYVFVDGKIKYIARGNEDGTRNMVWTDEIAELLDATYTGN